MEQKAVLVKARDLISEREHWIRDEIGRDAEGFAVEQGQLKNAICFCALGAYLRAVQVIQGDDTIVCPPEKFYEEMSALVRHVRPELRGYHPLVTFNDSHTHQEVLELFDAMIAEA